MLAKRFLQSESSKRAVEAYYCFSLSRSHRTFFSIQSTLRDSDASKEEAEQLESTLTRCLHKHHAFAQLNSPCFIVGGQVNSSSFCSSNIGTEPIPLDALLRHNQQASIGRVIITLIHSHLSHSLQVSNNAPRHPHLKPQLS